MYMETRLEDLQSMTASHTPNGTLRVFSGDNPARQFEAGKEEATTVVSVVSKPWITKTVSTVSDMSSFPWNSAAHLSQKGSCGKNWKKERQIHFRNFVKRKSQ